MCIYKHHLQFTQAQEADTLMTEAAKIASEAIYLKRFQKTRDGAQVTMTHINELSAQAKEANDSLFATGQALKTLFKMQLQKAV